MSSYAIKTDLKNVTHVDVGSFASNTNLASLKTEVDKLDIDELTSAPNDFAKLSNVVKNDVVKKTEYNKLVTKVDNIDNTKFGLKTIYDPDESDVEKKISDADKRIPDTSSLVKKTDYSSKITELENKIPSIIDSALTAIENKIPNISGIVKKSDYNTKISEIEIKITDHNHDKYITTPKFNSLAAGIFDSRLARANLITKTDFDAELKKISGGVTSNKTKHVLVETELKKLKTFDAAYFRGKNYFDGDGTQNYLVLQGVYKYSEDVDVSKTLIKFHANSWISKGLSNEKVSSVTDFERPFIEYTNARIKVKFNESILRQELPTSIGLIGNYYTVYRPSPRPNSSSIVLENCLLGKIKKTKNADTVKYKYQGHEIGFDLTGTFTYPEGGEGR